MADITMALDIKHIGNFMRREPLVHFVVAAGLLFLVSALWSGDAREVIRVDKATRDFLINQRAELLLQIGRAHV